MHRLLSNFKLLQTFCPQSELEILARVVQLRNFVPSEKFASSTTNDDDDNVNKSHHNDNDDWDQHSCEFPDVPVERDEYNAMVSKRGPGFPGQRRPDMRLRDDDWGSRLRTRNWNTAELVSFEKNFYVSHPSVSTRTQEEMDAYYEEHSIKITRGERPLPIRHFQEANFPDRINQRLKATGWSEPTPIQSIGWPLALSGRNLVGIARTGSGKTLGFLLPALVHIKHQGLSQSPGEPLVVVLAPTRELAQQIQGVASQFCRPMGIRSSCVFGGQSKREQMRDLIKGVELLVATPGRLIDFVEQGVVNLDRTTYVVLDEADRMLDMGFEPQIRSILSQIRPDRQILMWTATWPEEIQSLAHDFLGNFIQVNIGSSELTVNPNITQTFRVCQQNRDKLNILLHELQSLCTSSDGNTIEKTLIFVNTQVQAEIISEQLRRRRIFAQAIHGKKSQSYRENVLYKFRSGRLKVLVATDVAARGLDVDDIKVVINYSLPTSIDDYIHRIGRTARATKKGIALSLCTNEDSNIMPALISTLKRTDQDVDEELKELSALKFKSGPRKGFNRGGYGRQRGGFGGGYNRRRGDDFDGSFRPRRDNFDDGYRPHRDDFDSGFRPHRGGFDGGHRPRRGGYDGGHSNGNRRGTFGDEFLQRRGSDDWNRRDSGGFADDGVPARKDWICPDESCGNLNLFWRRICNRCRAPRPVGNNNSDDRGKSDWSSENQN